MGQSQRCSVGWRPSRQMQRTPLQQQLYYVTYPAGPRRESFHFRPETRLYTITDHSRGTIRITCMEGAAAQSQNWCGRRSHFGGYPNKFKRKLELASCWDAALWGAVMWTKWRVDGLPAHPRTAELEIFAIVVARAFCESTQNTHQTRSFNENSASAIVLRLCWLDTGHTDSCWIAQWDSENVSVIGTRKIGFDWKRQIWLSTGFIIFITFLAESTGRRGQVKVELTCNWPHVSFNCKSVPVLTRFIKNW